MSVPSEKKCLIVLGMHRSGTSALSGVLHLSGFDLGRHLMPPADENPKGFFENSGIVAFNDKILEELFSFWSDTLFIPDQWWKSEIFSSYSEHAREILENEFGWERPVLIKDPRLSIVIPLYLDLFERIGIVPHFLICVRNPMEVADSLKRRNNMPPEKSFLLWMDYQFKAELYSRDYPRYFVSHDDFLENPMKLLEALKGSFGFDVLLNEQTRDEIHTFLDPSLTHRLNDDQQPQISLMKESESFFRLQKNADLRDLTDNEMTSVDDMRQQFYQKLRLFNGLPEQYQATITILFNDGTRTTLTTPVNYGVNLLEYTIIQDQKAVKGMVFRPCNSRVGLRILKTDIMLKNHSVLEWEQVRSNASRKNQDGFMVFDTDLPKIMMDFNPPLNILSVRFHLMYMVFGIISCRKALAMQGKIPVKKD